MSSSPFYDEGKYVCEVVDQALSKTSTGKPQIVLKFRVQSKYSQDGAINDLRQTYERTAWLVITDKTVDWVIQQLAMLGYDRDSFKFIEPSHPQAFLFTGVQADFVCTHQDNNEGGRKEQWRVAVPIESRPLAEKPLESKDIRDLDNLFGKALKAGRSTTAMPSATPARPTPQPIAVPHGVGDDDVPF